jgi:hypothetical protein
LEAVVVDQKLACLIYVAATADRRQAVAEKLRQSGYQVREFKAPLNDALAARAGLPGIPATLAQCIADADLCVFLLPEAAENDGTLNSLAEFANQSGKRVVGIAAGARHQYPECFEDNAASMLRENSARLSEAIRGANIWERPDRSLVDDRIIEHQRCQ